MLQERDLSVEAKPSAWGELIVPSLTVVIVLAVLVPQFVRELAETTLIYGAGFGVPLLLLSLVIAVRNFRAKNKASTVSIDRSPVSRIAKIQIAGFLLAGVFIVLMMTSLGYLIVVPVYLLVLGLLFRPKNWKAYLVVSTALMIFIYVVFVNLFSMQLPKGELISSLVLPAHSHEIHTVTRTKEPADA